MARSGRHRQSVPGDALRRRDQRELHGLLRRPRHRNQGRYDSDRRRHAQLHAARAAGGRRPHRRVQPSAALHRGEVRRAARRRQFADREARRPDAAFVAAHRRAVGRRVPTRRVQHRHRRARHRRGAGRASEGRQDRIHRQRSRGPRRDERGRVHSQVADARARRQERAYRLRRCGASRRRRRRRARDELPLRHRTIVQFDKPRLSSRRHPRRGAGGDRQARRRAEGRPPDRARQRSGVPVEPGAVRQDDELHQARGGRRRAARVRRQAPGRPEARARVLRRADRVCRRHRRHADRTRGNLRAGGEHPALDGRG